MYDVISDWHLLELGNYKGEITKELVEQKYEMQKAKLEEEKKKILEKSGEKKQKVDELLKGILSFRAGLDDAYQYCIDDASIDIRNKIMGLSGNPNAVVNVDKAKEEPARIIGVRKNIRELEYLKDPDIMQQLLASRELNFDVLVPPEQPEKEIYYDVATGEIFSERKTETSILLARRKNMVKDGQFSITKREIYNIEDKATNTRHTQLTEYEVRRRTPKSITEESTLLYGEVDMERLEKDPEYRASFYKAFERARRTENPYIGSLVDERHILEESLEKNIAKKLRKRELGEYDNKQPVNSDNLKEARTIKADSQESAKSLGVDR